MIFASSLVLDHEPMSLHQLPAALLEWVQNAGMVAAIGVLLWFIARLAQRRAASTRLVPATVAVGLAVVFAGYGILVMLVLAQVCGLTFVTPWLPGAALGAWTIGDALATVSGAAALALVLAPIAIDVVTRLRVGRIWALARLSLKEAVRSRVFLIFAAIALIFLFAEWFVPVQSRPEDQVRSYVRLVYWSLMPLFLITISLLGAFSIPNDVKSLSIHTIVTKPVEKFEIVLGRFLGYAILLTVMLALVSVLSLGFVLRGINDAARGESFKARVPVFGELSFFGTKDARRGDNVGREWNYRSYITGPSNVHKELPLQLAIWKFRDLPADLGTREGPILFEFGFDIFRLSKGGEGAEGEKIPCTFTFADGSLSVAEVQHRLNEMEQVREKSLTEARIARDKALTNADNAEKRAQLAEEFIRRQKAIPLELLQTYKIYQRKGKGVTDYVTDSVDVPAQLFAALPAERPKEGAEGQPTAPLQVLVSVDRSAENQMLGVAPRDLYLLAAEKPFSLNFLKGIVGMWCTFLLVLGVAVASSTYLTGIISWLCTMFLFCAGLFTDFLHQIAENKVQGGGPGEAMVRIFANRPISAPLDETPAASLVYGVDRFFSWWVGKFLNLVPDVTRYDLQQYVSSGFDISWSQVLLIDNLIPLAGYLLPWAVLAYYLMKYREIANPT